MYDMHIIKLVTMISGGPGPILPAGRPGVLLVADGGRSPSSCGESGPCPAPVRRGTEPTERRSSRPQREHDGPERSFPREWQGCRTPEGPAAVRGGPGG